MKIPPSTPVYHTPISPSPPPIHIYRLHKSSIRADSGVTQTQNGSCADGSIYKHPRTTEINQNGKYEGAKKEENQRSPP